MRRVWLEFYDRFPFCEHSNERIVAYILLNKFPDRKFGIFSLISDIEDYNKALKLLRSYDYRTKHLSIR